MKSFEDVFSKGNIINYLCKQRAKIAKKRSKKHFLSRISKDKRYNYHIKVKRENRNNVICYIMPPRRLWVGLSKKRRYKDDARLNTIDKNKKAIYLAIQKHRDSKIEYPYLTKLDNFISSIYSDINNKSFCFDSPKIRPEPKDIKGNECRPIASFLLRDNLINCLTNKYLAQYFNDLFYNDSYAFRTVRTFADGKRVPTHHDAFQKIIDFLSMSNEKTIYVAECDMKKFYDTVNHKIVLKQFRRLCLKNIIKFKGWCDKRAERIFKQYLKCYNFYDNVFQKNLDRDYFKKYNINNGKFEWVKDDIDKLYKNKHWTCSIIRWLSNKFYKMRRILPFLNDCCSETEVSEQLNYTEIGIPQGGALSGLIANIVLDYADKKVVRKTDKDMLYVRYCDDMIMMHTDRTKCERALDRYIKALEHLKLFPHKINNNERDLREFSLSKSKGPYIWGENNVPWVGFVGYEINRKGEIRIRKRSLKKERNKQKELVENVIASISNNNLKTSRHAVIESVKESLIGMAIGRVKLWNYKNYKNDLCWAKGFNLVNNNKFSRMQVKSLDRSRNKYLRKLRRFLDFSEQNINQISQKEPNKQIIFLGKPFSYFFHVIEKKE
jgi:hypothetical protein